MKIAETLRGALRRMAGVSAGAPTDQQLAKRRRTSALPSIFNSYGPLNDAMPSIAVDPETFIVTVDGEAVTSDPPSVLPMTQRYSLF